MKLKKGTILIPCYNEEHNLPLLYSHLLQLMEDERGFCGSCTLCWDYTYWPLFLVNS